MIRTSLFALVTSSPDEVLDVLHSRFATIVSIILDFLLNRVLLGCYSPNKFFIPFELIFKELLVGQIFVVVVVVNIVVDKVWYITFFILRTTQFVLSLLFRFVVKEPHQGIRLLCLLSVLFIDLLTNNRLLLWLLWLR